MKNNRNQDLYTWCLEQAAAKYMGHLSDEQIKKLNDVQFNWEYYEGVLDKLGFDWISNSPLNNEE